jgi:hypothetical protein
MVQALALTARNTSTLVIFAPILLLVDLKQTPLRYPSKFNKQFGKEI